MKWWGTKKQGGSKTLYVVVFFFKGGICKRLQGIKVLWVGVGSGESYGL